MLANTPRSAACAERFALRIEVKAAAASTRVPPAVARLEREAHEVTG